MPREIILLDWYGFFICCCCPHFSCAFVPETYAAHYADKMSSLDGEWPFSDLAGIIWDILLSHVTKVLCCCQGIAAAAGRGLVGRALCNLLISSLGLPQEMWPKAEICQVSNPLEWESSLNRQILKWLWKLPEIIHKYLALSSFPAELCSCKLRKQKPVQTQALLTLDSFYFFMLLMIKKILYLLTSWTLYPLRYFEWLLFAVCLKLSWIGYNA